MQIRTAVMFISCVCQIAAAGEMQSGTSTAGRPARVAATEYRAFANCVRVERREDGGQNLQNDCDIAIEAFWLDTQGGRNQIRIQALGQYADVTEVSSSLACRSGDYLDWHSQQCHGYNRSE